MRDNEEGQSPGANEQRSPGFLPVEDLVDGVLAPFVETTGLVVHHAEDYVEAGEQGTPPEAAQLEGHARDAEVQEHEHAVGHVDHYVEEVDVVDLGVVHQAPVDHGHPQREARRNHVQEPVDSLELTEAQVAAGVEVGSGALDSPPAAYY